MDELLDVSRITRGTERPRQRRILRVEDNSDARQALRDLLELRATCSSR